MTRTQYREALEHVLTNILKLNRKYPIRKTSIQNDCDSIENLVNTADTDTPKFCYKTSSKTLEYFSIGHHNLIRIFIYYSHYCIHDNGLIGDDWVKTNTDNFNEFRIAGYDYFRILSMSGLVNPRPYSTTVSSTPYPPVYNFKISIKLAPNLFPDFIYQALWENWNFNDIATACTQDIEDTFHEAYVPSTSDKMDLFRGKINLLSFC